MELDFPKKRPKREVVIPRRYLDQFRDNDLVTYLIEINSLKNHRYITTNDPENHKSFIPIKKKCVSENQIHPKPV